MAALCEVALAVATPHRTRTDAALRACVGIAGLAPADVVEAVLQGIPYSGVPGAVEALTAWRRILEAEGRPWPNPVAAIPSEDSCETAGSENFRAIYGEQAPRVRAELGRLHPDLEAWVIEFCYGRVMGRGRLPLRAVEALAVASLLGQERRMPLRSHLRGALRTGWDAASLRLLVERLAPNCSPEIVAFARSILSDSKRE